MDLGKKKRLLERHEDEGMTHFFFCMNDIAALKKVSWSGIPKELRPVAWQLLLGYLPCNMARRADTLARKRKEYVDSVTASYAKGVAGLDQTLWHQVNDMVYGDYMELINSWLSAHRSILTSQEPILVYRYTNTRQHS